MRAPSSGLVLNDLKSRGVKDVYLFCVDGLNGFREAISAAYPQAQIQRCIIHQIRSSTQYVSWKDIKALMTDLKKVYQSVTEEEALSNLMAFKDTWGKQYPSCVKSWEENWDILSTFYAISRLGYAKPPEIRKIIYATNIIEGSTGSFAKSPRTNHPLPTTIPCGKSCTWHPKTLSNTGLPGVEIGTR